MTRLLRLFLGGVLLMVVAEAAPRPNIILFMADDMGWGDPGYNSRRVTLADGSAHPDQGWIDTPNMDAMAGAGLRFDRFYAASAVCSPTRASCLTGRNPFRVGVPHANQGRLGFDETPLSEILSAAGYACGHFGKWHLGTLTTVRQDSNRGGSASVYSAPWHHAFDACFATEAKVPTYHPYRVTRNSAALPTSFSDPNFYGTRYWRFPNVWNETSGEGIPVSVDEVNDLENGDDSKLIVDQALPFMREAVAKEEPFFLVLWFHTPHKPLTDPDGVTGTDSTDALRDSIEDLDVALGRVRDELAKLGVRDDTMLWLTSDNGPEDGVNSPNEVSTVRSIRSGRYRARKRSLFEGGVRVPGILEWPSVVTEATSTTIPAVTSDYYPTILDYLELSVPDQKPLDGISLRPVIEGRTTGRSKPIGFKFSGDESWVNQRYKLINTGSGWQLFDLIDDVDGQDVEQTAVATASNVASKSAEIQEVYQTMLAEFEAWDASVGEDVPYVHVSQPTVAFSVDSRVVSERFVLKVTFSEPVSQLNANEFVIVNGVASELMGEGAEWTVLITPVAGGYVTIDLPEGAVIDADGNPNGAATQLSVSYSPAFTAPEVVLSAAESLVEGAFVVTATFSEPVSAFSASDLLVNNGTASDVAGSGSVYTMVITPATSGEVTINLPADAATDLNDGLGNVASNTLVVASTQVGTISGKSVETALPMTSFETVDRPGNVPGDLSNNVLKFTQGTINDGVASPFTTDLFVRASSSDDARIVRAFVYFDVALLGGVPVSSAIVSFIGHSLNDQNDVSIELGVATADWRTATPSFDFPTLGSAIAGGSVIADLDVRDHSRVYDFDITSVVNHWLDGTLPNHGLQIRLNGVATNNGVGIKASGTGAIQLLVRQAPFEITRIWVGPGVDDVSFDWVSSPGQAYRVESSADLREGAWRLLANVIGSSGGSTAYTHFGGRSHGQRLYYRVASSP